MLSDMPSSSVTVAVKVSPDKGVPARLMEPKVLGLLSDSTLQPARAAAIAQSANVFNFIVTILSSSTKVMS